MQDVSEPEPAKMENYSVNNTLSILPLSYFPTRTSPIHFVVSHSRLIEQFGRKILTIPVVRYGNVL